MVMFRTTVSVTVIVSFLFLLPSFVEAAESRDVIEIARNKKANSSSLACNETSCAYAINATSYQSHIYASTNASRNEVHFWQVSFGSNFTVVRLQFRILKDPLNHSSKSPATYTVSALVKGVAVSNWAVQASPGDSSQGLVTMNFTDPIRADCIQISFNGFGPLALNNVSANALRVDSPPVPPRVQSPGIQWYEINTVLYAMVTWQTPRWGEGEITSYWIHLYPVGAPVEDVYVLVERKFFDGSVAFRPFEMFGTRSFEVGIIAVGRDGTLGPESTYRADFVVTGEGFGVFQFISTKVVPAILIALLLVPAIVVSRHYIINRGANDLHPIRLGGGAPGRSNAHTRRRWVLRHNDQSQANSDQTQANNSNQSHADNGQSQAGPLQWVLIADSPGSGSEEILSIANIEERLRSFRYGDKYAVQSPRSDPPVCSICISDFSADDEARVLPCSHLFHCSCIDSWLQRQAVCPVCRLDLAKDLDVHLKDSVPVDIPSAVIVDSTLTPTPAAGVPVNSNSNPSSNSDSTAIVPADSNSSVSSSSVVIINVSANNSTSSSVASSPVATSSPSPYANYSVPTPPRPVTFRDPLSPTDQSSSSATRSAAFP